MKKLLLFSFLCFFLVKIHAIKTYKIGDTLNVWAKNGLFIRSEPNVKSEKIGKLEYGNSVVVVEQTLRKIAFSVLEFKDFKIKGFWVKINYNDQIGYIFDGYLSKLPCLKIEDGQNVEHFEGYAKRVFGLLKNFCKRDTSLDDTQEHCTSKFKKNVVYKYESTYAGQGETFMFKYITFEEAFLFANIYFKWTKDTYKIIVVSNENLDYNKAADIGARDGVQIFEYEGYMTIDSGFSGP